MSKIKKFQKLLLPLHFKKDLKKIEFQKCQSIFKYIKLVFVPKLSLLVKDKKNYKHNSYF